MLDTLLDDINTLLLKGVGDKRILQQIKRAIENNELISVNERNYVANLRREHIDKKPDSKPRSSVIPSMTGGQPGQDLPRNIRYTQSPVPSPVLLQQSQRRKRPKRLKIIIGIAVIALVAVLIAGAFFLGYINFTGTGTGPSPGGNPIFPEFTPSGFFVAVDETSYAQGDIILISGHSDVSSSDPVAVSIKSADDTLVWDESITLRPSGIFSTLVIIDDSEKWDADGDFTVVIEHADQTENTSFTLQG